MPTFELYDILGVSTNATDLEIKRAYKKMAMKWHPDLHLDNQAEATEKFKEIQNAYSILSDAHERRWYDQHGDEDTLNDQEWNEEPNDFISDPKSFMRTTFFKSYDEKDPQNFYNMFNDLFVKLETQESLYASAQDRENVKKMPKFGDINQPFDSVKRFYREWSNFYTNMSFGWKDKWKISKNDPNINSWVRRQVEKENRAERRQAKQDYNTSIKNLVSWVKQRDRRILMEEERQRQEEKIEKKRREKQAKIDAELLKEIKAKEVKDFGEGVEGLDDDIEDDLMAYFEVSTNKKKKGNKKKSKKMENFEEDLYDRTLEDEDFEEYKEESNAKNNELNNKEVNIEENDLSIEDNLNQEENSETNDNIESNSENGSKNEINEELPITNFRIGKGKKKKQSKRFMGGDIFSMEEQTNNGENEESGKEEQFSSKKPNKKSKNNKNKNNTKESKTTIEIKDTTNVTENLDSNEEDEFKSKQDLKKQKRQMRKEKKVQSDLTCKVCKSSFSSRTKLFDHLKETKHAVFK